MSKLADSIIKWGYYLLFFLVPLWFYAANSELFEYNKMMLTYGLTIIIVTAWLIKLIANHQSLITPWKWIKRTPLDIPIVLYLLSHILSTLFSLDPHVSIWGYYSRFHESLLSTLSYILLYYVAVSNLNRHHVINILRISFLSAALVSVYGIFEHFGHSPSCLFITGNFNVDCWVQDVKNRVFATLGQPNWMAAYLDVILLSVLGFLFSGPSLSVFGHLVTDRLKTGKPNSDNRQLKTDEWKLIILVILAAATFAALWFTRSRSGLGALGVGIAVFILFSLKIIPQKLKVTICVIALAFAAVGGWIWFDRLPVTSSGISESGVIRKPVWIGAIKVWQRYPIFGSGVETFAYAYYQDRPVEHNLLSEWDFL
ncbi:O-antigen ligase family protein, partial [Candidatus Microgenomates bacterium]|nr:O-antigen ligase family protein [Candidatus Microgenomates bacterium]